MTTGCKRLSNNKTVIDIVCKEKNSTKYFMRHLILYFGFFYRYHISS